MMDMNQAVYCICNGTIYVANELIFSPDNRSFKYGDGFFETMKIIDGNIIFKNLHIERLFSSLPVMQFDKPDYFTKDYLLQQIQTIVVKNNHQSLARVRVTIFRGNGNLYDADDTPNYLVQSWALQQFPSYNEQGVTVDIYKEARKTTDAFSHIKSNNYLPYAMAALWSKKHNWDDALLINCYDRMVEATTANIFLVKDGNISTPALTEGCVAGVTRRYLLDCFRKEIMLCNETKITKDDILNADEIFLTNSGWYIQWIKQCGTKFYTNQLSKRLYKQFITPLYNKL